MRADIQPRHGHVTVDGLRLHYLEWGDPSNPPMLMLHGIAQQAHSWDFVAMDLGQDHYIISLDQRGHGDSDWAADKDYSPEAYQRDLHGVVQQLFGDREFLLVGLSMGGMNSVRYASENQHRLRGLVVVDISPQVREAGSKEIRNFMVKDDILDTFEAFVERASKYNPHRTKESFRGSLQHNLKQLPDGRWTWKYDTYFRDPNLPQRERPDLWPFVNKLKLPVLFVRGGDSHVVGEEEARPFVEALPDVNYTVVPDAGHLVPGDQPDLFSDAVRAWLETRKPAGIRA